MGHALIPALRSFVASVAIAVSIAALGCGSHKENPIALADGATRGVYEADYAKTTANFDEPLKQEVTRASMGALSDKMRALGAFQGLRSTASDTDNGRYDYEASFDKGKMLVRIRLDPGGKIAAYRVTPISAL